MRRNVELKAVDRDPARTLARALAAGAVDLGTLAQRDTYFAVPRGRLKLREERDRPALLIAYDRADDAVARPSEYELVEIADPAALADALERTVGVRGVVEKTRHLLLWEETARLHLDEVRGLGSFVEIEAVASARSDLARERDQTRRLADALGLEPADAVPRSYVDLLLG